MADSNSEYTKEKTKLLRLIRWIIVGVIFLAMSPFIFQGIFEYAEALEKAGGNSSSLWSGLGVAVVIAILYVLYRRAKGTG